MKMKSLITKTLKEFGLRPKKSLGQNFLISSKSYEKIMKAAEIKNGDTIIEIGAGLGILTKSIIEGVGERGRVIAIEKDDKFSEILRNKLKSHKNVKIINEDILKLNVSDLGIGPFEYKVVGNIPYYLTSRLIRKIFEEWSRPELIVLMVQKEVAQRIVAKPPKSNLLAISVQYFAEPKVVSKIKKECFWPKPSIDSALLRIKLRNTQPLKEFSRNFFKIIKAGFGGKRKQIINTLSANLKESKLKIKKILDEAGVAPQRRAETLTITEWGKLTKIYYSQR